MPEATMEISDVGRIPPVARLVRVGLGLFLISLVASWINAESTKRSGVSLIWLSNGLLIGVLLCSPKRQWPAFLLLGYVADLTLNLLLGSSKLGASVFSLCNFIEVIIAASLTYRVIAPKPDLTQARQLFSLLLYGVLLAPAVASVLATCFLRFHDGVPLAQSLRFWFAADLLGIATITPLYISSHYGSQFSSRSKTEIVGLFLLLCTVSLGVFWLTNLPVLWLVLMALLLLGVRLGFTGSAAGLLLVTCIGGYLTVEGLGPLGTMMHRPLATRVLLFQSFVALTMLALYVTEVSRSANRRTLLSLETSEARFRSLAEASRDVIVLADLEGRRRYISPAVTELLGWLEDELLGHQGSSITHPEDWPRFTAMLSRLKQGHEHGPLAYRCMKKDGGYLWLEGTARLMRDAETREPNGFVYVLRDISDRKAAEQKMQEAYETVEKLAMVDGLTGVANRRLLDETLNREWVRGIRDGMPMSLLLIDVDHFKAYNDLYGHLAGDECLSRLATEIQSVLRRPSDLLARFGGEEFVAVLPNTHSSGAERLSEEIRKVVEDCCMPHSGNPPGVVTVSLGCATEIPDLESDVSSLLKAADAALYRAKATGRNCTRVSGDELRIN